MVEKFRGVLPDKSIWYRFTRDEALRFVGAHKEIEALLPKSPPLEDLDSVDLQAFPGKTEAIEKLIKEAGLPVVTLFD